MRVITAAFLASLETNMKAIMTRDYDRLVKNLWWEKLAKKTEIVSKKERIFWGLETAQIKVSTKGGGQARFEDLVMMSQEVETTNAIGGLTLKREQMVDMANGLVGGEAMRLASAWSQQIAKYSAYWPQKLVAQAIKDNPIGYDGLAFFAQNHLLNPFKPEVGTFHNIFTGAASGIYPGALPIHSGTVEAAQANLSKAIAYIASIKQPTGEDPRGLRVHGILVPPALTERATQITQAKFINNTDVTALVSYQNLGVPIQGDEFGSAFTGGSDTDYYLLASEIVSDELGAFSYIEREPFSVLFHDEMTDAQLARKRELQWTTEGRNSAAPGHPYLLFKCRGT